MTAPVLDRPQVVRRRPARRRGVPGWWTLAPAAVFVLLAIVGPWLVPHDPEAVVGPSTTAPNGEFWWGTDSAGMDVFSRSIAAIRVDLVIAASVTVLATLIGAVLGVLAGSGESRGGVIGVLSRGLSRILDLADAVPVIVVAMVVVSFFGASSTTLVVALSVVLAPNPARLTRAEVLRVRSEAYLDAGRIGGLSEVRLSVRHVLPNATVPALENCTVILAVAVTIAAALGFLGVGITPPTPEWGSMVARGTSDMISGRWWSALFPSVVFALAVASLAVAGNTLNRRLRRS